MRYANNGKRRRSIGMLSEMLPASLAKTGGFSLKHIAPSALAYPIAPYLCPQVLSALCLLDVAANVRVANRGKAERTLQGVPCPRPRRRQSNRWKKWRRTQKERGQQKGNLKKVVKLSQLCCEILPIRSVRRCATHWQQKKKHDART
jgi:hypothetical protein